MPKISVHLEADSPEEFRALLAAFQIPLTSGYMQQATPESERVVRTEKEAEKPVLTTLIQDDTRSPVVEAPVKPKRGRPFKTAPVEPEPASVDPAGSAPEPAPEPVKAPVPIKAAPKAKEPEIIVSRQDLLDAFSEYVQRYGASFGFSDISQLLQKNLGDGVRKASDVPEAQLQVAIGAIKSAINDNPFNRKRDYA